MNLALERAKFFELKTSSAITAKKYRIWTSSQKRCDANKTEIGTGLKKSSHLDEVVGLNLSVIRNSKTYFHLFNNLESVEIMVSRVMAVSIEMANWFLRFLVGSVLQF